LHAVGITPPARDGGVIPTACNGSPALCDRHYNEVSYPTAHNAMSNADEHWSLPNQHHNIPRALTDGVRGLQIDTHDYNGVSYLCHGACGIGKKLLAQGLCEIAVWMDQNPGEVVTLQIEDYITPEATEAAFVESGLIDYVRVLPPGGPFPTLGEMVADGHRLVVFSETAHDHPAWYMPLFDYSWDTPYSFMSAADFSCDWNRGTRGNPLFTVNHFISDPVADLSQATMVNTNPVLLDRARQCQAEGGQLPNFLAVDFYDVGDLFEDVRMLNGL
jgi:hypothetical protein